MGTILLKKKEFIFIGGILILLLAMWGGMSLINKGSHGSIITVDGKEYGTYSLKKDQTIKINDTNVCRSNLICTYDLCTMPRSSVYETEGNR